MSETRPGSRLRVAERLGSLIVLLAVALVSCTGARAVDKSPPLLVSSPQSSTAPPKPPEPAAEEPCGALACRSFAEQEAAFRAVLRERPLVLAVGEAHALKQALGVPTTPRRFAERFLPIVAEMGATDLVVELLVPDPSCRQKSREVEREQAAVTEPQAETNQNDYVELGRAAARSGLGVHALETACADYDRILASAGDSVLVMLELIRNRTIDVVERLLALRRGQGRTPFIVVYGGAMHNDIVPKPGREDFSFGEELSRRTLGRYAALDLIVPEYIKQNEVWKALPWFEHYDAGRFGHRAILFSPEPASFVLVLPRSSEVSRRP